MGFSAHPSPLSLELSKFTLDPTKEQLNRYKAIKLLCITKRGTRTEMEAIKRETRTEMEAIKTDTD